MKIWKQSKFESSNVTVIKSKFVCAKTILRFIHGRWIPMNKSRIEISKNKKISRRLHHENIDNNFFIHCLFVCLCVFVCLPTIIYVPTFLHSSSSILKSFNSVERINIQFKLISTNQNHFTNSKLCFHSMIHISK